MKKQNWLAIGFTFLSVLAAESAADAAAISLANVGTYLEHFNSLANTASSSVLPQGWSVVETGASANLTYSADNGTLTTPNTYSYGTDDNTERGLGSLNGADFGVMFGAELQNNTGNTIASVAISYRGEVWRLGSLNLTDRLDFQYSTDATSLTDGTWTDFNALDFSAQFLSGNPAATLGQHSGNSEPYYTDLGGTITGLAIPNEAKFWLRWTDADLEGFADDALAIDQFRITPSLIQLPEPSGLMLLAGLTAFAALRHRATRRSHA